MLSKNEERSLKSQQIIKIIKQQTKTIRIRKLLEIAPIKYDIAKSINFNITEEYFKKATL